MAPQQMLDDTQIRVGGIDALNKALGHTGAMRFLVLVGRDPTDYVKISRRLYRGQTVQGIFKRAEAGWKRARR